MRALLSRLNRVQRSRWFKYIASGLVVALAIGLVTAVAINRSNAAQDRFTVAEPKDVDTSKFTPEQKQAYEQEKSIQELTAKAYNELVDPRGAIAGVAVGLGVVTVISLAVIWLGVGLTSLAFLVLLGLIAGPMAVYGEGRWAGLGKFTFAVGVLGFCFVVLMESLRALLSPSVAVLAIARNVVMEATRMRVSIVFIVMLMFALAAVPGLLDPGTPLRFRVQNFLQYGTGGTFWIIAMLVVFLSVATVAFEQRDKIIWQTMTKPVAAWQYLLGKWLGVVSVAAVLLAVSSAGVFLFTEYLRQQPAQGEMVAFVPKTAGEFLTEDRSILESQVLTARRSTKPDFTIDVDKAIGEAMQARVQAALKADPNFKLTDEIAQGFREQIEREVRAGFSSIEPNSGREFVFSGLKEARDEGRFITLRYKADVGANDPRTITYLTFLFKNVDLSRVQQIPAGQRLTIQAPPAAIDPDGKLYVWIGNGRPINETALAGATQTVSFGADGLEVYYPAGSYRMNYLRVVGLLWLKLAFLAMVGVCTATFLSFAVAAMTSFGVLFVAESASFLSNALDYYGTTTQKGNLDVVALITRIIAWPIATAFKGYSDLRPTTNLVDGLLIPWSTLVSSGVVIGAVCALLFAIGTSIFRRRELATYSGQ